MADWKKVIVSGSSNVELANISTLDTALSVGNGGTGATSLTDGGVILGSGAGAVTALGQATNGQLVIGNTGGDPILAVPGTAGGIGSSGSISVGVGAGSIKLNVAGDALSATNLSSSLSSAPSAGKVVTIADDGVHFDFSDAAAGDVQQVLTPTNGGLDLSDTSNANGKVSITMSLDELAAETSLQGVDEFAFHDVSDTTSIVTTKKVTLANLSGSININRENLANNSNVAGAGITIGTDGAISMSINRLQSAVIDVANDEFAFKDGNDNNTRKDTFADLAEAQAGGGLEALAGVLRVHTSSEGGIEYHTAGNAGTLQIKVDSTAGANTLALSSEGLTLASTIPGDRTFSGNQVTFSGNSVRIDGDLAVAGTASFTNADNLSVADKYILLNSGSTSAGDGGIVIQQAAGGLGELFGFDADTNRFGVTSSFDADLSSTNFSPAAFMSQVVTSDVDFYRKNGNIRVESNEIYIYIE